MSAHVPAPHSISQVAIFAWGVLGVVVFLAKAVSGLFRFAHQTLAARSLTPGELAFAAGFFVLILYAEGYRGFQKAFSPRTVARAVHLAHHPTPLSVVLAPLYCMALFGATRRRLIANWVLLVGIVGLVLLMRLLPPLYRALVDLGVGSALAWGTVSIVVYAVMALRGRAMPVAADVK